MTDSNVTPVVLSPQQIARFKVACAKGGKGAEHQAKLFEGAFGDSAAAFLAGWQNVLAAEKAAAEAAAKAEKREKLNAALASYVQAKNAPKSLLAKLNAAATLGLPHVVFTVSASEDPETGEVALCYSAEARETLASPRGKGKSSSKWASVTVRGETYDPTNAGCNKALAKLESAGEYRGAFALCRKATGQGNLRRVFEARGWVYKRSGKLPSPNGNVDLWACLKALSDATPTKGTKGSIGEELSRLRAEVKWNRA